MQSVARALRGGCQVVGGHSRWHRAAETAEAFQQKHPKHERRAMRHLGPGAEAYEASTVDRLEAPQELVVNY